MRVLVTAASRHEATGEIAEAIAAGLTRRGVSADALPVESVQSLRGYDAVVLGSAVYMGRWLKPARRLIKGNLAVLTKKPVWLFSSGPLGPADHAVPDGDPADASELVNLTHAREHRVFGGRLEKKRLGIGERAAVKAVHAPEGDSRDWKAIDDYAARIAAELQDRTIESAAAMHT